MKRYAKAAIKYMKTFDKKKPSNYSMYSDSNNLCCWAMSKNLSEKDFKFNNLLPTDKILRSVRNE